jgi:arylsulfatase A-like enzyme
MAAEGIRFTSFYMASPVCSPSRGAMMTGSYPKRIGFGSFEGRGVLFPGQGVGLNPQETTIARALKEADYATMLIGKWHCGDQLEFLPTRHGFDHYYGIPFSNDMGRQAGRGVARPPLPLVMDEEVLQQQPDQTSLTERYAEQAVRFIRDNKERPFFLYLAHMHVHLPLYVAERFLKNSQNGPYGAAVECIDWVTGVLLDELSRQGLTSDTLILFTSDNGSRNDNVGSNGPLRGKKATTWEGGMRVPFIAYWPGKIAPGQVCDEVVASLDFFPTLTALAGCTPQSAGQIDGSDIRPLLFSEAGAKSPREAFYYYWLNNLEAVRSGRWKLHVRKRDQLINELYDLDSDIGETTNVYDQHPDVVARLNQLLEQCRRDLGDDATGVTGANCRPIGRVDNPHPLTEFNENHPYYMAVYDLGDAG